MRTPSETALLAALALTVAGCGGEPTAREVGNARSFEALLSAVSLRDRRELEGDARRIDERYALGEVSEDNYKKLREIVDRALARDWAGAERLGYEFRSRFGDGGAYFR